jgi:3-oxoacyl-[acyl-carrier protein] reductase
MELDLKGKLALVTGSSRGIGQAIAKRLAEEGCCIALVGRDADRLTDVRREIEDSYQIDTQIHVADLAAVGSAKALFAAFPHVDILVNNAGAIPRGDLLQLEENAWRKSWDLKLFGTINITREYYRAMKARRSGVIVNIVGLAAEKLDYDYIAGSAANAALVAFTRTLGSMSIDFGVRVFGVNPGWVETEKSLRSLRKRALEELGDADRWQEIVARSWPMGTLIQPHEIAASVAFLCSHRAVSFSGQMITIDAGFAARSYTLTQK